MTTDFNNYSDIMDSRDVIARITELQDELEDAEAYKTMKEDDEYKEEKEELTALLSLAEEGEASPDWQYGETLIRDSYFTEYAQQLAEDIGAIGNDNHWPLMFIDWEAAADCLKYDYISVDFDGQEYWIRA